MGLQWEREARRETLNKAIESAIIQAIGDAQADYDDRDVATLRDFLVWWYEQEIPETVGGKDG